MKILILGGNRFVGLRLSLILDAWAGVDLHILNRSGQVAHSKNATIHKANRDALGENIIDKDWDVIIDFACFTGAEALAACRFFGKVGRYIFVSTASVYEPGSMRSEKDFIASSCKIVNAPSSSQKENLYQFGKQQAEAVFAQEASFPVVSVRFSFITGVDDYTRRMEFHAEHILDEQALYLPNPKAKISLVDSEDAAQFLAWCVRQKFTGPVNFASPETVSLEELLALMEKRSGRKMLTTKEEGESNVSPYSVPADFTLNVELVKKLGYSPKSLASWLPQLLAVLLPESASNLH